MTLQDLFRTVWFGKWLVLVSVIAALVGAWMYVSRQEPQYASETTVQLVDAETLSEAGVRLESDPALVTSDDVTAAAAKELDDPGLADVLAAQTSAEYALENPSNVVISETGVDPGDVVDRANAIAKAYVAELKKQYDADLDSMQERLTGLATSIDAQQKAITASRRQAAAAAATINPNADPVEPVDGLLEAQYSTTMDQYQTLSSQLTQAQLLTSPASILQNAVRGQLVSIPASLIYAAAALAGLLIGIGLAVARRGLDTKVRTNGTARRSAGAPVLARLSGTAAALRSLESQGTLPVARREATAYTRSVRELRTALQAAVENDAGGTVIVVTAADLETPRSFVAANLAASWALSGRSVVVLSGDLRQPRLNALLPASAEASARPARGASRLRSAAVPTAIPHLSVHPALQTELDPADFLASEEVRALVEHLRSTADVVIVDAPPALVSADATILGSYADGVLLAVTLGHTPVAAVEESADRLRAGGASLLGLALDGAAERRQATYEATYVFAGTDDTGGQSGRGAGHAKGEHAARAAAGGAGAGGPAAGDAAPGAATAVATQDASEDTPAGALDEAVTPAAEATEGAPADAEPADAAEPAPAGESAQGMAEGEQADPSEEAPIEAPAEGAPTHPGTAPGVVIADGAAPAGSVEGSAGGDGDAIPGPAPTGDVKRGARTPEGATPGPAAGSGAGSDAGDPDTERRGKDRTSVGAERP